MFRGQLAGAESLSGLGMQGIDPELLGPLVGQIIVGAVAGEAFALAQGNPIGDLVAGAGMRFDIGKAFGQKGLESVGCLPLCRQRSQGGAEGLAGEVRLASLFKDEKAGVVDDELETFGPGHGVPANPVVALFET